MDVSGDGAMMAGQLLNAAWCEMDYDEMIHGATCHLVTNVESKMDAQQDRHRTGRFGNQRVMPLTCCLTDCLLHRCNLRMMELMMMLEYGLKTRMLLGQQGLTQQGTRATHVTSCQGGGIGTGFPVASSLRG